MSETSNGRGGKRAERTPAQALASAQNGRKGGRPRKVAPLTCIYTLKVDTALYDYLIEHGAEWVRATLRNSWVEERYVAHLEHLKAQEEAGLDDNG